MSTDEKARAATAATESASTASGHRSGGKVQFTRRFPRFTIDVRLQVKMFQAGEFRNCWGRSTEMGQDGIGATLTGTLEAGEVVAMELTLPMATYPIKFRALVRYHEGLRHGFEFLALTAGQREEISRVCQMLAATT